MNTIKKVLLGISLMLVTSNISADSHKKEVMIKSTKLSDTVYMLTGQGGNIGLSVGVDGVFMIDDQFAPLSAKIKKEISTITNENIKFLINTHWHFDHTGGNENFGKEGVVIVAHDNVRKRMSKDSFIKAFNKTVPAAAKVALPVITFNDEITFNLNNDEIKVTHLKNAHTDGDSIIHFKSSNVIHTGDIFFNGAYPFIDESSKGDIEGIINATNYILTLVNNNTKIIPGHGKIANKADLINYRDTLITIKTRMQKLIEEGKTLEQVIALKPNADLDDTWGKVFLNPDQFLTILYTLMSNKM
jgi:glyoxylase-like metal-dependent hydrolase (beta-lactamase superfamily II)